MICWHVQTTDGDGRFEYAADEEEMRRQMIEYYNEQHAERYGEEPLPEDASLSEAIEAIEAAEDVSYEEVHNGYQIDGRERDTVLAALRLWEEHLAGNLVILGGDKSAMLAEVANNGGTVEPLTADEIDALCERINT